MSVSYPPFLVRLIGPLLRRLFHYRCLLLAIARNYTGVEPGSCSLPIPSERRNVRTAGKCAGKGGSSLLRPTSLFCCLLQWWAITSSLLYRAGARQRPREIAEWLAWHSSPLAGAPRGGASREDGDRCRKTERRKGSTAIARGAGRIGRLAAFADAALDTMSQPPSAARRP
jgi:hypothetical protein